MILYEEIGSPELLEKIVLESFKGIIAKNGEHPISFNIKYKRYGEFIGYTAYDDDKMIGIIFAFPFHSKEAYACTYNFNIYLLKEYRGTGIAKELFSRFTMEITKNRSIKNLIATVYNEQSDCLIWLIKNSFVDMGHLEDIDTESHSGKEVVFLMKKSY